MDQTKEQVYESYGVTPEKVEYWDGLNQKDRKPHLFLAEYQGLSEDMIEARAICRAWDKSPQQAAIPGSERWSWIHLKDIIPDPKTPGRTTEMVQRGDFRAQTPEQSMKNLDDLKPDIDGEWQECDRKFSEAYEKSDELTGNHIHLVRRVCEKGTVRLI